MDVLTNFFTLRPVFTFWGIKIAWYIYLLHMLIEISAALAEVSRILTQNHLSWLAWSPNSIPLILGWVAQIIIVRLLLEMAATILLTRHSET